MIIYFLLFSIMNSLPVNCISLIDTNSNFAKNFIFMLFTQHESGKLWLSCGFLSLHILAYEYTLKFTVYVCFHYQGFKLDLLYIDVLIV